MRRIFDLRYRCLVRFHNSFFFRSIGLHLGLLRLPFDLLFGLSIGLHDSPQLDKTLGFLEGLKQAFLLPSFLLSNCIFLVAKIFAYDLYICLLFLPLFSPFTCTTILKDLKRKKKRKKATSHRPRKRLCSSAMTRVFTPRTSPKELIQ